jgi:hypothetical protein
MNTLKYFLSETGIHKFQDWYLAKPSLQPIHQNLDNYITILSTTKYHLDINNDNDNDNENDNENTKKLIQSYLESHIKHKYNKTAIEIFLEWLDEINTYCYQGGYGHSFTYPDSPHHWVINPEFYDKVSNIPEEVAIAACITDKYIYISPNAEWESWSS